MTQENRQAGAGFSESDLENDIEVTPDMIEAGISVFEQLDIAEANQVSRFAMETAFRRMCALQMPKRRSAKAGCL